MKTRFGFIICISIITILALSPGCKKAEKFAIEGSWTFSRSFDNLEIYIDDVEIYFTGNEFRGEIHIPLGTYAGSYNVDVSNEIDFKLENGEAAYTGTIVNRNYMEGTYEWKGDTGTWSATR